MARRSARRFFSALALAALAACVSKPRLTQPSVTYEPSYTGITPERPMLTVGLISDAQLQTLNAPDQVGKYRSRLAEKLVAVSLRPPALDLAAPYMMQTALDGLTGVELVIYTGDAANNGCKDEIDRAFDILTQFRARTQMPVFYAIGNHDYLGAGNTSNPEDRQGLCGENNVPYTKLDIIRIAHTFNGASAELLSAKGWKYLDSFSPATVSACEVAREGARFRVYDQHMKPGCYYAAILTLADSVQILILDTSDYASVRITPPAGEWITSREFAGIRGAISFDTLVAGQPESQGEWLKARLGAKPAVRVLASHYGLSDTRWQYKGFGSRQVGWPSDYLKPVPEHGNRWLYGHTHTERPEVRSYTSPMQFCADDDCAEVHEEVNVGSTTDWMPHAAIASIGSRTTVVPIWVGRGCEAVETSILDEARNANREYAAVNGATQGAALFGLDRSYQKYPEPNSGAARTTAYSNVTRLVARLSARDSNLTVAAAWTCVGALASEFEESGKTLRELR